ncbi:MAG: hypothetical protein K5640_02740 [Treponema sp.]|nr:hypothetical protein [Treponema sp.]
MLVIGHRGCHYRGYNQNTIRAFKKVVSEGAKAFEFDVQLTKDKKMVVVHNLNLSKVSTGSGLVREKTLAEIRELYAGKTEDGFDRIPTLSELFDLCASYSKLNRPAIHLELKGDDSGSASGSLIKEYVEGGKLGYDDFLISSFSWPELVAMRKVNPEIKIALLDGSIRRKALLPDLPGRDALFSKIFNYGEENFMLPFTTNYEESCAVIDKEVSDSTVAKVLKDEVKKALSGGYYNDELLDTAVKMNATSVNLWYNTVTKEFIAKAHAKGLKVFVYTVNAEEDLRRLPELGVDGFFTDYWANSVAFMTKEGLL